jgi:hypothetical protein
MSDFDDFLESANAEFDTVATKPFQHTGVILVS